MPRNMVLVLTHQSSPSLALVPYQPTSLYISSYWCGVQALQTIDMTYTSPDRPGVFFEHIANSRA